jgi:hypothetical protein
MAAERTAESSSSAGKALDDERYRVEKERQEHRGREREILSEKLGNFP